MLPNCPETVVVMLAAASIGAVFSSCSPDFGMNAVVDRFGQIEPRLVLPMHFGFYGAPDAFFEVAKEFYPIRSEEGSTMLVSRKTLPRSTEIRFLQGGGGY